ncbi:hypothetical protein Pcinc_005186 [Petrolisthes cinctipes]|uniref:Uncharacterized protein n=1 Tax=Petrolisthes cinctipes TaxID=88211 RepID=A0AAE1KZD0_PETCI|nr:hypothetical protein Pcinc_005186 [Petrolisthes cinctipes]
MLMMRLFSELWMSCLIVFMVMNPKARNEEASPLSLQEFLLIKAFFRTKAALEEKDSKQISPVIQPHYNWKDVEENSRGRGFCDINPATLANSELVPLSTEVVGGIPGPASSRAPGFTARSEPHTPTGTQVENDFHDPLGQSLKNQGLSKDVAEFLLRSASTSKAAMTLPLSTILETVGWSQESTFALYYRKPLCKQGQFGEAVLS